MTDQGSYGFAGIPEGDDHNNSLFLAKQQAARIRTTMVVKVIAVYPGDPTQPNNPTTVDVQPMVNQAASDGTKQDHGTVYGLVVARHHAGGAAILIDPAVGDVGMVHVADRDISSVKANAGAQSNPGSGRRHDMSDGIYHGGIWTPPATNCIDLRGGNISVTTPGNLTHTVGGTTSMSTTGGPVSIDDGNGNFVKIDHANNKICIIPASSSVKVYLGGDPADGGVFGQVQTTAGTSDLVYAHVSGPI